MAAEDWAPVELFSDGTFYNSYLKVDDKHVDGVTKVELVLDAEDALLTTLVVTIQGAKVRFRAPMQREDRADD